MAQAGPVKSTMIGALGVMMGALAGSAQGQGAAGYGAEVGPMDTKK